MIPKIIHQIWIGPNPPPLTLMQTWKDKHPDFEYILWNEEEIVKRNLRTSLQHRIDEMESYCGKADILRLEILHKYGGIYLDADSICIEPIHELIKQGKCFATYENEIVRGAGWTRGNTDYNDVLGNTHALIANGTMAFSKDHPFLKKCIKWIENNIVSIKSTKRPPWRTTGPGLFTRIFYSQNWENITILPSYTFLPVHHSGVEYDGHGKIYAYQEWGSTKQTYGTLQASLLPSQYLAPHNDRSVSLLIPSLNTNARFLRECFESIKSQRGHFNIEVVVVNDGSDDLHSTILERMLEVFQKTSRFTSIKYIKNETNKGLGYSLNKGLIECTNEIVLRMDTDDIMTQTRIQEQYDFITSNPECVLCGSQITLFRDTRNGKIKVGETHHPHMSLTEFKTKTSNHWLMNHPTFCMRKSKIIDLGNYNASLHSMCEDFELILRVLKKHDKIYNMPESLLYYRIHEGQVTHNGGNGGRDKWTQVRNKLINDLLY